MKLFFLFMVSYILIILTLIAVIDSEEMVNEDRQQVVVVFNYGTNITLVDRLNNISQPIVVNEHPIVTFDYHLEKDLLFWASQTVIYRSNTKKTKNTSSKREVLVIAQVERVGDLCVDWVHDRLYWTDVARGQVETAALDGNNRSVIYRDGRPSSIAVDPLTGKLFWIEDSPLESKIRYTRLDGSYRRQGFAWQSAPVLWESREINSQSPLALDPASGDLYFTQQRHDVTWVMAANHRAKTIRLSYICSGNVTYFAALGDKVYWDNASSVCWNQNQTVKNKLQNYKIKAKQVKIFSAQLQPPLGNICEGSGCTEECFAVDKLPTCACNFGSTLKPDLTSCDEPEYYLLYTTDSLYRMTLKTTVLEPFPKIQLLWHSPEASIFDVDIHVKQNLLFWTNNRDSIYVSQLNRAWEARVLVNCTAKSLSVDWLHDLLYWTEDTSVMVGTLDGKVKWQVAMDPNKPFSLVIDPINRLLFWSTCGWEMMIVSSALDGSARRQLVTSNVSCATSLSADSSRRRLYWVDRSQSLTSSVYYDGQIRHNIRDPRVKTASVYDSKLIWTSTSEPSLFVNEHSWSKEINLGFHPSGVVVFSGHVQREASTSDGCGTSGCQGMCLPGQPSDSWRCVCPQGQLLAEDNSTCLAPEALALAGILRMDRSDFSSLSVLDYNSSSVTLLVDSVIQAENYIVTVEAISSYQTRDLDREKYKVKTNKFPFVIPNLQTATSYSVRVEPQPTYLGVWRIEASTNPLPQEVIRLPLVYKPWDSTPIPWILNNTADHFDVSTAWQPLIKEFILLMFYTEGMHNEDSRPIILPQALLDRINQKLTILEVKDKFVVIKRYESIMEFDRDPEMHLTNTPFGTEFYLMMCQVTEYRGSFGVDVATSETTEIPWPRATK